MQQNNKTTTEVSSTPPNTLHRGCIYNIEAGKNHPTGTEIWPNRPGLIISNDAINEKAGFVTIVYLTTSRKRDMPYHVKVKSGKKTATALCEQIHSVDKSRLGSYIGEATPEEMQKINVALSLSLATVGTSYNQCSTLFKKWAMALEKNDIDISGNPDEDDKANAEYLKSVAGELTRCRQISAEQEKIIKAQAEIIETLQSNDHSKQ